MNRTRLVLTLDMDSPYVAADFVASIGKGQDKTLSNDEIGALLTSTALVAVTIEADGGAETESPRERL
jgi:hypothetical protein